MINRVNALGGVRVGGNSPVRIMGILNASPESFYGGSVYTTTRRIREAARRMELDGADFVDVGGMSTAPYQASSIPEKVEIKRVVESIRTVKDAVGIPISVDTCRACVARAALEAGAEIVNDVSGLKFDPDMPRVISEFAPSLVLGAYGKKVASGDLVQRAKELLQQSIMIAKEHGVAVSRIAVDPAIGFFRRSGIGEPFTRIRGDWTERDVGAIRSLRAISQGRPVLVSVSRKSFLGEILKIESPADRLYGSIAAEAISVLHGADIIRTHNIPQTRDAVAVASRLSGRDWA